MYLVQFKASGQPIGVCGLVRREFLPGPDLGFALLPEFVGRGYATEAAHAGLRHAQHTLVGAREAQQSALRESARPPRISSPGTARDPAGRRSRGLRHDVTMRSIAMSCACGKIESSGAAAYPSPTQQGRRTAAAIVRS